MLCVEISMLLYHVEQIAAWAEVEDEVDVVFGMESRMKLNNKRIRVLVELAENISLADDLFDTVQVSEREFFV